MAEGQPADLPLFRREVLDARQAQWLGAIRIGRPLSFTLVTTAAIGMAAALIAFAWWGEVTRKVTVHGVLLPRGGLIHVAASQTGVLAELFVHEGDNVIAGQPIAQIRNERITAAGDTAALMAQALQARKTSLASERRLTEQNLQQRQEAILQRLRSLQAEERQAEAELSTNRLRVELSLKSLERQNELAKSGFVAVSQVQQKQEELLDLQLRERNAQRSLQALERDVQTTRADKLTADNQAQTALAQLDRTLAALDQEAAENDARTGLTLTAPQSGRISALPLTAGQTIQATQTVASIVPQARVNAIGNPAELQAQLFAPSRTSGFLRVGQKVYLRYGAFPYQKFGMAKGEVISISHSPIAPVDLPSGQAQALMAATQVNEPLYRVTVQLSKQTITTYGEDKYLNAGMSLEADVVQDHRRIWEWLLEPAIAASSHPLN